MGLWSSLFNKVALCNEDIARQYCEFLCNKAPESPRLKSIAAVGAYDAVIGGKRVDSRRLTGTMGYLLQSGVLIDPDFSIDIINFSNKRDFLKEDARYDMVFVSFILREFLQGTYVHTAMTEKGMLTGTLRAFKNYYGCALSAEHNDERWQKRLASTGSKIIATYGGSTEIGTSVVVGGPNSENYVTLIPSPRNRTGEFSGEWNDYYEPDLESHASLKVLYNDAANDLPMPWLGFAASCDYVKAAHSDLSEKTTLGRNARMRAMHL